MGEDGDVKSPLREVSRYYGKLERAYCWMREAAVRGRNIAVGCGCKLLEMSELIMVAGDGTLVRSSFLPAQ